MSKQSPAAKAKIHKVMSEYKSGQLHSGKGGGIVTKPKQAIAIAISEARRRGMKVGSKKAKRKG